MTYCDATGKEQHATAAVAHYVARRLNGRGRARMSVYQCHACRHWHIGHNESGHHRGKRRRR